MLELFPDAESNIDQLEEVIATLIENCKIAGVNPHTWMTETLTRLANGHPANALGELMPWTAVG